MFSSLLWTLAGSRLRGLGSQGCKDLDVTVLAAFCGDGKLVVRDILSEIWHGGSKIMYKEWGVFGGCCLCG